VVKRNDALFDGAGRHQPVHRHRPLLADAVRATHGLVFGGRVPPRVGDDHVVGGRQVQTEAAGLEADEEEIGIAALERRHPLAASRRGRGPVQNLVPQPAGV